MPMNCATLVVLSSLLFTATASADMVPADAVEPDCPAGSTGNRHSSVCAAWECSDSSPCPEGRTCRSVRFCATDGTDGRTGDPTVQVRGECGSGSACAEGTCRTMRACVESSSGGCAVGGSRSDRSAGWIAALAVVGVWARRRARGVGR